jgi:hypothetical protein
VIWPLSEVAALVLNRSLHWSERESALEEGWLLADLEQRFGYGLEELARQFDRSVSWVSRRLALVELLPNSVQQQVRAGEIPAQVAMKYLVPVARVSLDDCQQMAAAFARCKFTSRQARQLYAAWREASPQIRQRLLEQAHLFLKLQREVEPQLATPSPLEELSRDLEMIVAITHRPEQRKELARKAARARWARVKKKAKRRTKTHGEQRRTSFGVSTRRVLRTLERHTNRSYVEKHPLRTTLGGTLQGDETIPGIPTDPVSVCVRNDAAASHIIGDSECDLEDFGNERVSEAFARKSAVYRKSCQQNQRQFVWRKAAHIFLWEGVPWHTCRRESEISNHAERRPFVDRHVSHTNGAFLLIRPCVALQIIVERLVATVERLDFVVLFETTDENGHSASHCPDEGFGRMGGFSRCEVGKALQFARRPGNFHAREHDLWRDAFEPRQHQFLARARFGFTKNAMTALSFPYCPAEQC